MIKRCTKKWINEFLAINHIVKILQGATKYEPFVVNELAFETHTLSD